MDEPRDPGDIRRISNWLMGLVLFQLLLFVSIVGFWACAWLKNLYDALETELPTATRFLLSIPSAVYLAFLIVGSASILLKEWLLPWRKALWTNMGLAWLLVLLTAFCVWALFVPFVPSRCFPLYQAP